MIVALCLVAPYALTWPAAKTATAPAPAACVTAEDDWGWVPLRCGNHMGSMIVKEVK